MKARKVYVDRRPACTKEIDRRPACTKEIVVADYRSWKGDVLDDKPVWGD